MFITFEGGEGSGKTTQVKLLAEFFKSQKKKVFETFEPGDTALGKSLRKVLLSNDNLSDLTELLLFAADRVEHVEKVIKKKLKQGFIVLCDRYIDSTTAYQVGGRNLNPKLVEFLNGAASMGLKPDLTFLLDIPAEIGVKRALVKNKFERKNSEFHKRVRRQFLKIAKENKRRVKVIDATRSVEEISKEISKTCKAKIFGKRY